MTIRETEKGEVRETKRPASYRVGFNESDET